MADTARARASYWLGRLLRELGETERARAPLAESLATGPVQAPRVPLLIGGGGERVTLRQVAAHADMCNFGPNGAAGSAWGLPEVRRKLAALGRHCAALDRPYAAVLRSHFGSVLLAESEAAGMRYFIVSCGRDDETLRLLAREVAPHVGIAA